jgi:hypothetical protein
MGHPEKSCRKCGYYIRGNAYSGPNGYGGCFRTERPTHANQKACDDFSVGKPCLSVIEADLKAKLKWHQTNWRGSKNQTGTIASLHDEIATLKAEKQKLSGMYEGEKTPIRETI